MALNINFQGNVVDENENPIDCVFQAFSNNISTWSLTHTTEAQQYQVNAGDSDLNTQTGSLSVGDVIMVAYWQPGNDRNTILDRFAVVAFVYDGNDNVVQDVQLRPAIKPDCSFILDNFGEVGIPVTATSQASDIYQWAYAGKTHFHRHDWYGQVVFNSVGISVDEFNFNLTGYGVANSYTFLDFGDYTVQHRVVNNYGQESICQRDIRITFRPPVPGLIVTPNAVSVGSDATVTATIQDIDSRIVTIDHIFDGFEIAVNANTSFAYTENLTEFRTYIATQFIDWDDGFAIQTIEYNYPITMDNLAPIVELSLTESEEDKRYKIFSNSYDIDGTVDNVCWELYYGNFLSDGLPGPFFDCKDSVLNPTPSYVKIYEKCDVLQTELDMLFAIKGLYKVVVTATDNLGATGSSEIEFNVDRVCLGETTAEGDCSGAVELAINNYKKELELRNREDGKPGLIVVQDGRASGSASGKVGGQIDGNIQASDLTGKIDTNLDGNIGGGTISGGIGGKMSGKVKK